MVIQCPEKNNKNKQLYKEIITLLIIKDKEITISVIKSILNYQDEMQERECICVYVKGGDAGGVAVRNNLS